MTITTLTDYIKKQNNGELPMVGRDRGRAEYYLACLYEMGRGDKRPCWYRGQPAMVSLDYDFENDEDLHPISWDEFFAISTQDIQYAIQRDWVIKVGNTLVARNRIPEDSLLLAESARGTRTEAFALLRNMRNQMRENE